MKSTQTPNLMYSTKVYLTKDYMDTNADSWEVLKGLILQHKNLLLSGWADSVLPLYLYDY